MLTHSFLSWARLGGVLLCLLCVAACGKRPGEVDPYPGVSNDAYNQVYPDLSTDPKPPVSHE